MIVAADFDNDSKYWLFRHIVSLIATCIILSLTKVIKCILLVMGKIIGEDKV